MVNKFSNVPLYSQLKDLIIKKIETGEYAEDSKIPSEQELCDLYTISRPTVRQAISELTNNGFLYKEKGRGTFVSKTKATLDIKDYSGFTDSILDSQNPGEREYISASVLKSAGNKKLEELFNLPLNYDAEFASFKYLTIENKEICAITMSYIPLNLFPDIINDVKGKRPSFEILSGKYPYIPVKSKSALEIIYMDHMDAHHLQVQTGQALLKIENVLYSKSGQVVEYIITKYRADKCKLVFENSK